MEAKIETEKKKQKSMTKCYSSTSFLQIADTMEWKKAFSPLVRNLPCTAIKNMAVGDNERNAINHPNL